MVYVMGHFGWSDWDIRGLLQLRRGDWEARIQVVLRGGRQGCYTNRSEARVDRRRGIVVWPTIVRTLESLAVNKESKTTPECQAGRTDLYDYILDSTARLWTCCRLTSTGRGLATLYSRQPWWIRNSLWVAMAGLSRRVDRSSVCSTRACWLCSCNDRRRYTVRIQWRFKITPRKLSTIDSSCVDMALYLLKIRYLIRIYYLTDFEKTLEYGFDDGSELLNIPQVG